MQATWRLQPWSDTMNNVFEVTIDPERIFGGRNAFGPYLGIELDVKTFKNPTDDLFLVSGAISDKEGDLFSSLLIPSQLIYPNRNHVVVPLTDQHIEALENIRKGGPLHLYVNLLGAAPFICNSHNIQNKDSENRLSIKCGTVQETNSWKLIKIDREKWLKILSNLTNKEIMRKLVEIPFPNLPKGKEIWAEAIAIFERAIHLERNGHYDLAVQECRKVVEGIKEVIMMQWGLSQSKKIIKMKDQLQSIKDLLIKRWGEENQSNAEALVSLIQGCWEFTSGPHHYARGNIGTRHQVLFLFNIISALFIYAGLLIED